MLKMYPTSRGKERYIEYDEWYDFFNDSEIVLSLIALLFAVVCIGKAINRITPKNGINEALSLKLILRERITVSLTGQSTSVPYISFLQKMI